MPKQTKNIEVASDDDNDAPEAVSSKKLETVQPVAAIKKTTAKKKRKRAIAFLDASVLDQVVEEEQQEKTQQDASTVQQQQQTIQTDKVTIVSQDQKPTIIKHFEEYKVKVRVLGKSNLYSAPQSIDPKITTFLQQHFYGGRIRRENTLHWHGEKRKKKKMAQPALQFAL